MGNYTWFIRCIANHPVEDDNCVRIIELLAKFYNWFDWYFKDWVNTLSEDAQGVLKNARKTKSTEEFKERLTNHDGFPRTVSMKTLMGFFEDRKLYGYMEEDKIQMMNFINQHCLPQHVEMMMMGIYEGFGSVAMGWCTPQGSTTRKFITMLGFERYKIYSPHPLRNAPVSLLEYIENAKKEYETEEYKMGQEDLENYEFEHREAVKFRAMVLDPLDRIDWSASSVSINEWLQANGFEVEGAETTRRCTR